MAYNLLDALNVRVIGSDERYLVFAHGFGTDQSAWKRILPYSTPSYKVVMYNLICAGSVNPDIFNFRRYTTLDPYVDDLLFILDSISTCFYVGHSISSMIGLLASIRRPELFSKLILVDASPRFLNDVDYFGGFEEGEIETVFAAMEANYAAWVNGFTPLAVGADVSEAVREFSRTLFNMRPDMSLFVCRTVFNNEHRGFVKPVLVQKLADQNNISLGCGFVKHIWFGDRYEGEKARVLERNKGEKLKEGNKRGEYGDECGISVVTITIGYLKIFEDVYRMWGFVARFMDADFLEKERWRYTALNQRTLEV